ncbi:MAG: sugar transferase, partial [Erysipelotrichaceae bacterium]|nr:sugar transferase [Erysipelotrichaceae bacterium]
KKYVNAYTEEMYATLLLPAGVTSLASIKFKDEDRILQSYMKKDLTVDEIYETYIIPKKMKLNLQYLIEFNILCDIRVSMKTLGGLLG